MNNKIFFKLSGELLTEKNTKGFQPDKADKIAEQLAKIVNDLKFKIGIVVGGGNIFRGRDAKGIIDSIPTNYSSDYMGIVSTFINSIGLQDYLVNKYNIRTKLFSSPVFPPITEEFNPNETEIYFSMCDIMIFAGGIGQPGFTTDTCAILKAKQVGCKKIFKGTKVEGVYDKDPHEYGDAKKYDTISYEKLLKQNIKVMDMAAFGLARESNMQIVVFNATDTNNIYNISIDNNSGTSIVGGIGK